VQDKVQRITDIHEDLDSKIDDLVRVQYEANRFANIDKNEIEKRKSKLSNDDMNNPRDGKLMYRSLETVIGTSDLAIFNTRY